jgi:hypothetical protein
MAVTENKQSQMLVYAGGLVIVAAFGLLCVWRRDPAHAEVRQIVAQLGPYPHYEDKERALVRSLHRMGSKAYPALARLLRGRDTKWDALYARYRLKLPVALIRILPNPASKDDLSRRVKPLVGELGPVAARALLPAVCDVLRRENQDPIGDGPRANR